MTPPSDNPAIMLSHALRKHEAESAGDGIGLYTLVEKLGDGGFGSVWRASQSEPVGREVALKIIKLGMDTLEVMSRFEQERVALSMMDHPSIAKVLDAGATPEGRPFFVMELVRGVPITTYCIEKQVPLEQRLRLFKEVCVGVQHAHQKGIIHRDLKPSNILVAEVDGVPVPKIIDFGIAKAVSGEQLTEHTLRTRAEQMIGTPLYMSPEQADGSADIDTRSDVYALGVLLYELLAGQPPFDAKTLMAAGYEEMRRIIREEVPARPSSKGPKGQKGLPPTESLLSFESFQSSDLDLITLRALEKDRARRYDSATALAEDIRRFLEHQPVSARAPSLLYLARRWARRHRAAAAVAVAIVVGASLALWQAVQATRARDEARHQLSEAEAMTKLVSDTLASLPFEGSEPTLQRSELMRGIFYRLRAFEGDPLRKARLLDQLAKSVAPGNAPVLRREAVRLAASVLPADDAELRRLREALAGLEADRQANDPSLVSLREKVQQREATDPASHDTARAVKAYARGLFNANQPGKAEQLTTAWLQRLRKPDGTLPPEADPILRGHTEILCNTTQWAKAEAALRELLAGMKVNHPDTPQRWGDQSTLGDVLVQQGRHAEALPLLEEAVSALEKVTDARVREVYLQPAKLRLAEAK